MKIFKIIFLCIICSVTVCSCNSNRAEKAQQILENVASDEEPSQKQYSDALKILNENFAAQSKLVDEAMNAINNDDEEKAQEILNKIRNYENAALDQQLISMLKTADLDDANRAAFEKYEQNSQALSDKIVEIVSSMIDI